MTAADGEAGGVSCPVFPKLAARAAILCDGAAPPTGVLAYWLADADCFLCTDAAGRPYEALPRRPDVVIGDFDTIDEAALTDASAGGGARPRFVHVADQDTTDAEKALLHACAAGMSEAVLLGALGRRLDHTLFNCSLLERFASRLRICLSGFRDEIVRLDPTSPARWSLPTGTPFSLLPLSSPATGVTVTGARYPLADATIAVGGPATVSNEVVASPLQISLRGGSLLVTVARAAWFTGAAAR